MSVCEILIHDNNSDEDMRDWLLSFSEAYSKVRVIYSNQNKGVAGGRNVLFKEARGDVIVSVDSDSYCRGLGFVDRAKLILSDTGIGMCGVVGANFSDYSKFEHVDIKDGAAESFVDSLAGCCQIFRKSLYGKVFSMDTNYSPFWLEDTDLCLQLKAKGYKISSLHKKYSINENLMGATISGSEIDTWNEPSKDCLLYTSPSPRDS